MIKLTPEQSTAVLEIAFVVTTLEAFGEEEGFPPLEKIQQLTEAINHSAPTVDISAEDVLNCLFEKYNIQ